MRFTTSITTVLAVASSASAFIQVPGNSIVAYWGQGNVNIPLSDVCSNPNVDIVVLSFVNVFPDQSADGWPGTNFGSSCGGQKMQKNGVDTQLLDGAHCGTMIPDIAACQAGGKKVLLSLAGGFPTDQWLHNDTSAVAFADFLIGAFGAPGWTGPRPIGDSQVDGFDFDIESNLFGVDPTYPGVQPAGTTFPDYMSRGYAAMANHIHAAGYLTSSAPQCKIPDAHLDPALSAAWFDYVFVQFYNTNGCSAMDFIQGTGSFNYNSWASATYINPLTKVYIGLPASSDSANAGFYLTPTQVHTLLSSFTANANFGGVMLWEATASARNLICGNDYAWWVRKALDACFAIGGTFSEVCPSSSSSSSIASSTSSIASSTSSSVSITASSSSSVTSSSSSSSASSSSSVVSSSIVSSSSSSSSSSSVPSSSSSVDSSSSTSVPASPTITSSSSTSSDISSSSSTYSPTISSSSSSDISSSSSSSASSDSSSSSYSSSASSSASSSSSSSSYSSSSSTSSYSSSSVSSTGSSSSSSSYSSTSSTPGSPVLPSTTSSTYSSSYTSSYPVVTSSSSSSSSFYYYPNSTYTTVSSSTPGSPVIPSTTSSEDYPSSSSSSSVYYYDDPSTTSSASSSSVYYYDDPSTTLSSSSSSVYYYDDPSTTSSSSSAYYYDDPSSSTPVKPTVTSKPYYSYDDPSYTSTSVYTTTITTTYVDVCPTGLTTVTATYKTTVCPGSTTPAVPVGWTTTVTVCKNCGPKPTTITITKPYAASTAVEIVTLVVKPVPEKEYYSSMSTVVVPSVPAAPVKAAPSYPVAPVAASSYPVAPVSSVKSSSPVSPVQPITYAAASGYAAPTGSKTGYPAAQFTGAASRVKVGLGAFIGFIIAAAMAM